MGVVVVGDDGVEAGEFVPFAFGAGRRGERGPSGGGTYGTPSAANAIGDGQRGLWAYRYPVPLLAG